MPAFGGCDVPMHLTSWKEPGAACFLEIKGNEEYLPSEEGFLYFGGSLSQELRTVLSKLTKTHAFTLSLLRANTSMGVIRRHDAYVSAAFRAHG